MVAPLLSAAEVGEILSAYGDLVPDGDEDHMVFDYLRADRAVMEAVADLLQPYWDRHVPEVFADHEVVFSTFVIKPPGPHTNMYLHDDRTYVDEQRFRSCTMWVPLVDTSPELDNGCLCVVPGSHRIMATASGTNIPDWVRPYEDYLARFARPETVAAGSMLVYDTKTVHSSPPNRTDAARPAIAVAIVPREADLIHVVGDGDKRHVYAVDRAFFQRYHPHLVERGMPPEYERIDTYVEERVDADPEAVAAVGDPADVPVPAGIAELEVREGLAAANTIPDEPAERGFVTRLRGRLRRLLR